MRNTQFIGLKVLLKYIGSNQDNIRNHAINFSAFPFIPTNFLGKSHSLFVPWGRAAACWKWTLLTMFLPHRETT